MVDPVKAKFRKTFSDIDKETKEKLKELDEIFRNELPNPDSTVYQKAFDDFMKWRREKQRQLFSEFRTWVFSD